MQSRQIVKDILVAIENVRSRAKEAKRQGEITKYYTLMADLQALEFCLVSVTKKYIDETEQEVA